MPNAALSDVQRVAREYGFFRKQIDLRCKTKQEKTTYLTEMLFKHLNLDNVLKTHFEGLSLTQWQASWLKQANLANEFNDTVIFSKQSKIYDQITWQKRVEQRGLITPAEKKAAALVSRPFPSPAELKPAMNTFAREAVALYKSKPGAFKMATNLHHKFLQIHPYIDAHGRTARKLQDFCLMAHGYQPAHFEGSEKRAYHLACERDKIAPEEFLQLTKDSSRATCVRRICTTACNDKNMEELKQTIEAHKNNYPGDLDGRYKNSHPLHFACNKKQLQSALLLLRSGFDPDVRTKKSKRLPEEVWGNDVPQALLGALAKARREKLARQKPLTQPSFSVHQSKGKEQKNLVTTEELEFSSDAQKRTVGKPLGNNGP